MTELNEGIMSAAYAYAADLAGNDTSEEFQAWMALYLQQGPEDDLEFIEVADNEMAFAYRYICHAYDLKYIPDELVINWDATAAGILTNYTTVKLPDGRIALFTA